jgi:chemotaxis protein histidine kinase CheA
MARSHGARKSPAARPTRDEDLIARAEAAMVELSSHFAGWMADECRRLEGALRRLEADPSDRGLIAQLFRVAHDIKGEAGTFGFPMFERATASLCRLIGDAPSRERLPLRLVARHVAAVRRGLQTDREGEALISELERATAQFLSDAQAVDNCPEIESPPLAP